MLLGNHNFLYNKKECNITEQPVIHMVTLGTSFEDLNNELESMLDMISEALDLLEKDKKEEAMDMLADLEEAMLDFLDYEEAEDVEEGEAEEPAP